MQWLKRRGASAFSLCPVSLCTQGARSREPGCTQTPKPSYAQDPSGSLIKPRDYFSLSASKNPVSFMALPARPRARLT